MKSRQSVSYVTDGRQNVARKDQNNMIQNCCDTLTVQYTHSTHSQYIRGAFKKFCNSTIKKNGNVTNCTLFFNIITTEFNAFATFFWQTVNNTKIEFFCLSFQPRREESGYCTTTLQSRSPRLHSRLFATAASYS